MALLKVEDLKVHFPMRGGLFRRIVDHVKAVDGVSFSIEQGQTYGLVGESGSGKTTTGRSIIGLNTITSGEILFEGTNLTADKKKRLDARRDIQVIFQDPYSSLNPKKRVLDIVAEPLRNFEKLSKKEEEYQVQELLAQVGLSSENMYKYPHEFSGGQRQRIGIARAIALKPKLIIADEPVSALDVSVQAQVLNFMQEIQKELKLTYLFISHDLGIIRHMCDRIGIMYKGRYVEEGTSKDIFENPQHIYTKRLVAAIPDIDPRNREKQQMFRQAIKEEYEQSYSKYFNEKGLAYDLSPLSNTHLAALPEKG
ncbi:MULTISPECIES: ABC transporter ATP-binding protein [Bacillus]|uniref:Peptide ABC transporter substrate-binding protein n=2 Tax=Bacillus TaxID=1386 RepID=A0A0M4FH77_9BACI|nr:MULTISPECIES: ATP-binding cassette domain-containing protein [Bacillus]ALC80354.1 peptide ABC transporter substrate-binding protein [Bacillus gobiensis]MBP1083802.1 peptide/nickel transport system ATP-binding protein [Bacillus capparidis]MED1098287.1 ATP-binding cassette domain-containing protein [Bacillus capparidis]